MLPLDGNGEAIKFMKLYKPICELRENEACFAEKPSILRLYNNVQQNMLKIFFSQIIRNFVSERSYSTASTQ